MAALLGQLSSDVEIERAEEHAPTGGDADDGADEAADRREDPWNTSLPWERWKSMEGFSVKGIRPPGFRGKFRSL